MNFEEVKSFLSQQGKDGVSSVYEHLAGIVRRIVEEKPNDPLSAFENISLEVKESHIQSSNQNIPVITVDEEEKASIQSKIDDILLLYGKKPEKAVKETNNEEEEDEEEEEEEEEPIDLSKCPNILQDINLLSWAGIGFEADEYYQLQNAFTKLLRKHPSIEWSRFWGKIHGIYNDYWIVETKLEEYPAIDEENIIEKSEEPGKGVNEYVYFVCSDIEIGNNWIQLPYITDPMQIKTSKKVHQLFTGNLDNKIKGRAYFGWNESVLLRAYIARISHSTILAPNEYYQKPEEEDEDNRHAIELNEEFTEIEEPLNNESWVHTRGHLRLEGRIDKFVKEEEEEEENDDNEENDEKEEKEPSAEELEEEIEILESIKNDKCNEFEYDEEDEISNVWYIRSFNQNIGYGITILNHKLWNGAKTIYLNGSKKFINIYIGNGMRYTGEYYTPNPPASIQNQFNELIDIEIADPENEDEMITKKESIFNVQNEVLPPPPEPENNEEENDEENEENESENDS